MHNISKLHLSDNSYILSKHTIGQQKFSPLFALLFFLLTFQLGQAQTCTVNSGVPFNMCQDAGTEWTLYGNTNTTSGGSVPITWTVISEPTGSAVAITSPSSETTTVTNVTTIGAYTFQISGACPDGSGTATDQVTYNLEEPLPDPMIPDTVTFCKSGSICVPSPDPTITYGWIATDFAPGQYSSYINFSDNGSCLDLSLGNYRPGTSGKILLYSTRGACTRIDTVGFLIGNDEIADAGDDVWLCGDSWCKHGSLKQDLDADEYRWLPYGGTMAWAQVSGPSAATITYNPSYVYHFDSYACFSDLQPGTYEFELTFTYNDPCFLVTRDSFFIHVTGGSPGCNVLSGNYWFGDCDNDIDEWVIDLKNYGLNPAEMVPGDSIIWYWDGDQCSTRTTPAVNSQVVVVDKTGICDDCELHATYICADAPGCGTSIQFNFFDLEIDCTIDDYYACSPDGNPVTIGNSNPSGVNPNYCEEHCAPTSSQKYYEVVNSDNWAAGTLLQFISTSIPFSMGIHEFKYYYMPINNYLFFFPKQGKYCQQVYPFNIVVQGSATGANAGTDIILPCSQTSGVLSGSDPDVPSATGSTSYWQFISGPNTPTMGNQAQQNLPISNLIDGLYVFKYEVGNAACGFFDDYTTVVVSSAPPTAANAGVDETIACYGIDYQLSATPPTDGIGAWTVSPSAGVTFSDTNDPNAIVSGLASGTAYTFTWTVTNGCGTSTDDVVITVGSTQGEQADAGADACISTTTFNLTGNTPTIAGAVGTWTMISNSDTYTISDVNDPNATLTSTSSAFNYGSYCLEWSIASPGCQVSSDIVCVDMVHNFRDNYYDHEFSFCDGPDQYTITPQNGNSWTTASCWSQDYNGPPGVVFGSAPNSEEQLITFPEVGAYSFTIKSGQAECAYTASISVYISDPLTSIPSAGIDQVVCEEFDLTMDADPTPNGGFWTVSRKTWLHPSANPSISGTITFSDVTDPQATISFPQYGEFCAVWNAYPDTVFNSQCLVKDTLSITIIPEAIAGNDKDFCTVEDLVFYGNSTYDFGTATWSFVSGPATPTQTYVTTDGEVAVYTDFTQPGAYTFDYELTTPECGTSNDTMVVNIGSPEPNAGLDFIACQDSVWVYGSTPTSTDYTIDWTILEGIGYIGGSQSQDSVLISDLLAGDTLQIEYSWTTLADCVGRDTVQIIVDFVPNISTIATNATACEAADGSILIAGADPNTTYDLYYLYGGTQQGPISITTDVNGQYTITGLTAGSYADFYIENDVDCTSVAENLQVMDSCELPEPTCPTISITTDDTTLCEGETLAAITVAVTESASLPDTIQLSYFTSPATASSIWSGAGTSLGQVMTTTGDIATLTNPTLPAHSGGSGNDILYVYAYWQPTPSDPTCRPLDSMQIVLSPVDTFTICIESGDYATLMADASLTGVTWYNSANQPIGTGNNVIVNVTAAELADGIEAYHFTSTDASACETGSCCPVYIKAEQCCKADICMPMNIEIRRGARD